MIANFHTHTTFCDGRQAPEEIVRAAIDKGFSAIGFSGHGYTPFDLRYCMKDTDGYIAEVERVKRVYRDKIEVYLGIEEDAFAPVDRTRLDYLIGSSHYFCVDGTYYPIDSDYDYFKRCLEVFGDDIERLAETYYTAFCEYLRRRRPDIIGHFDVITKFDEVDVPRFSCSGTYRALAKRFAAEAARAGCLVEVNTGPVWRGYRSKPLPSEELLHVFKTEGVDVILSSDSHSVDTLDHGFDEAVALLRQVGFRHVMTLRGGRFVKEAI